jgi:hypothetical protein
MQTEIIAKNWYAKLRDSDYSENRAGMHLLILFNQVINTIIQEIKVLFLKYYNLYLNNILP